MCPEIKAFKINKPGLKLRAKSEVHANIIDETTGRRKTDIKEFKGSIIASNLEKWPSNGVEVSDRHQERLIKDINWIKKNFKTKPADLLILGPGKGAEVIYFKDNLSGTKTNIDTLGLTNYLSIEASKLIRKDLSKDKIVNRNYFEHLNHLDQVKKYDYIFSKVGPAVHTNYPEIVLLKVASLLRPGGFARIDTHGNPQVLINIKKYLKTKNLNKSLDLALKGDWVLIKRFK